MSLAEVLETSISQRAFVVMTSTGVGTYAELYALMRQFPSIANDPGISLPALSNVVASRLSFAARATVDSRVISPVAFARGSRAPGESAVSLGFKQQPVDIPEELALGGTSLPCMNLTPVRDQGQRGTCVAHAVTACAERYLAHNDLSEQFLYWGAKLHGGDPYPADEGTWLWCAKRALADLGICSEPFWAYNPGLIPGDQTHEIAGIAPSGAAISDAQTRLHAVASCADVSSQTSGKAAALLAEMQHGPVAISLPVFQDPVSVFDNWNWFGAVDHGHVLDPTQFSVVVAGHAVCACGYHPSGVAPGGGWFVFKNSWGTTTWNAAAGAVPPGHPAVPAGYGYISASYVDQYLWEYLRA